MPSFAPYQSCKTFVVAVAALAVMHSVATAEKIEFSTSRESVKPTNLETRKMPQNRDILPRNPDLGPSLTFPTPQNPLPNTRRTEEELDRKKNWIFARPEDSAPKIEELFNVRDVNEGANDRKSQTLMDRYIDEPKQQRERQQQNALKAGGDQSDYRSDSLFSRPDQSQSWQRFWENDPAAARRPFGDGPSTLSDMWTKNASTEALNLQNALRNNDFKQTLEPRNNLVPITAITDLTQQPANPIVGSTTEFNRSPVGISDQWKGGIQPQIGMIRSPSALDELNARQSQTASFLERNNNSQSTRMMPQPAVLPGPTRPGEIFKRPGSF